MEKAMIVSGSEKAAETIAQFLHTYGCTDITAARSGSEARRLTNTIEYALIIVNTPLSDEFGHELQAAFIQFRLHFFNILFRQFIVHLFSYSFSSEILGL